jgi:hypothetical protein
VFYGCVQKDSSKYSRLTVDGRNNESTHARKRASGPARPRNVAPVRKPKSSREHVLDNQPEHENRSNSDLVLTSCAVFSSPSGSSTRVHSQGNSPCSASASASREALVRSAHEAVTTAHLAATAACRASSCWKSGSRPRRSTTRLDVTGRCGRRPPTGAMVFRLRQKLWISPRASVRRTW